MYKYLIDGVEVTFNSYDEKVQGLDEADANGYSVELISDDSEDLEVSTNPNEVTLENLQNGNFATDTATSAEVVSKTAPAQNTELPLENGSSDSLEPLKGEELNVLEGSETIEFASLPEEVKQKTKSQAGVAKMIGKTFVKRDVYQLDDKFSGQSVNEMDKENKLTMLTSDAINDYFASQPEETLLDSDQIDAIAFNMVSDLKKEESVAINNEDVAVFTEMQKQGNSEAFEKATVSTEWNTYSKNKKGLILANQKLAIATNNDDGSEESVKNLIELRKNQNIAQSTYKTGSTDLFDLNTGERLNKPQAIQYAAENVDTTDYSDQIKDAMRTLPKDRDRLKAAWLGNAARKNELKQELQNKITLVSKSGRGDGIERDYSYEDLMKLRNMGTDLEIFDVVIPKGSEKDSSITQVIDNEMFDDLNSRRRALNIKGEALDQSYLLNIDPGSIEKTNAGLLSQFEKVVLKSTFGDVIEDFIPQTQRDLFDSTEKVFSDLGIEATKAQKENFERTFAMQATEGVGYFVPELAKFAVANAITGGVLGTAKTMVQTANGWKAITLSLIHI